MVCDVVKAERLNILVIFFLFWRNKDSDSYQTDMFLIVFVIYFFFLVAPTLGSLLPLLEHRAEFPQVS
jgi:amino acid permease